MKQTNKPAASRKCGPVCGQLPDSSDDRPGMRCKLYHASSPFCGGTIACGNGRSTSRDAISSRENVSFFGFRCSFVFRHVVGTSVCLHLFVHVMCCWYASSFTTVNSCEKQSWDAINGNHKKGKRGLCYLEWIHFVNLRRGRVLFKGVIVLTIVWC